MLPLNDVTDTLKFPIRSPVILANEGWTEDEARPIDPLVYRYETSYPKTLCINGVKPTLLLSLRRGEWTRGGVRRAKMGHVELEGEGYAGIMRKEVGLGSCLGLCMTG
jgi:hypothetical protein